MLIYENNLSIINLFIKYCLLGEFVYLLFFIVGTCILIGSIILKLKKYEVNKKIFIVGIVFILIYLFFVIMSLSAFVIDVKLGSEEKEGTFIKYKLNGEVDSPTTLDSVTLYFYDFEVENRFVGSRYFHSRASNSITSKLVYGKKYKIVYYKYSKAIISIKELD